MNYNDIKTTITLTFVETCYDFQCICNSLVRYTVDISNNLLSAQIVVKSDISDDEQDNLRLIMTYIAAQFGDIFIEENFIKISHLSELQKINPFPIKLYKSIEYFG